MTDPLVERVLRSVPGWARVDLDVVPLEGGITNRNYVVTVDGQRYVLRVPGADTELLGIDRANEYRAASVAAEVGVGPEVVAFLPETGCFVTRFVDGSHIPMEDLRRDDVLGLVVRSLRAFHGCPPIPSLLPGVPDRRAVPRDRGAPWRGDARGLRGRPRRRRPDRGIASP